MWYILCRLKTNTPRFEDLIRMIRKISIALLSFVVVHTASAVQQANSQSSKNTSPIRLERTVKSTDSSLIAEIADPEIDVASLYSKSYALLIGNSQYQSWSHLKTIPNELNHLEEFLKTQGFDVIRKNNLQSDELKKTLHHFLIDNGTSENHRLLIFFAGHGHTIKALNGIERGYIVPIDAPRPAQDENGFKKAALGLEEIKIWTQDSKSNHILFLFDSCFSGSIVRSAVSANRTRIEASAKNPVHYVITAGDADETVPGASQFVPALLNGLRDGEADLYPDNYITSDELTTYLEREIPNRTSDKNHPKSGQLNSHSLQKSGQFIFTVDTKNLRYSANDDDVNQFLNEETRAILEKDTSAEDRKINELFKIKNKNCQKPDDNWLHVQKEAYSSAHVILNGCALSKKDYEEALNSANLSAVSGYLRLGQMYLNGWGGAPKQKSKALEWFRKAAKQGNPIGQLMSARLYLTIDEKTALKLFRKAAEQDDASGQYAQGLISLNCCGSNQNEKEALKWFRQAAAQGDERAKRKLAELEAKGIK
jgi:TPR repeat protein